MSCYIGFLECFCRLVVESLQDKTSDYELIMSSWSRSLWAHSAVLSSRQKANYSAIELMSLTFFSYTKCFCDMFMDGDKEWLMYCYDCSCNGLEVAASRSRQLQVLDRVPAATQAQAHLQAAAGSCVHPRWSICRPGTGNQSAVLHFLFVALP